VPDPTSGRTHVASADVSPTTALQSIPRVVARVHLVRASANKMHGEATELPRSTPSSRAAALRRPGLLALAHHSRRGRDDASRSQGAAPRFGSMPTCVSVSASVREFGREQRNLCSSLHRELAQHARDVVLHCLSARKSCSPIWRFVLPSVRNWRMRCSCGVNDWGSAGAEDLPVNPSPTNVDVERCHRHGHGPALSS
jgi:hypothetical protein